MSKTVLIVDGDRVVREIMRSMLISAGYKFDEASNGVEALNLLNSGPKVDVIVSELMMAELDGIGLLEQAQQEIS